MMLCKAALPVAAAVLFAAPALAAAPAPAPAPAASEQSQAEKPQAEQAAKPKFEVVERDAKGRATIVRLDGVDYKVCSKTVTDGCINPRSAGLDFGSHDLQYWPGKPASEIDQPLPWKQPEQKQEQMPQNKQEAPPQTPSGGN